MYFNGIGRITDYLKIAQLEQKWQEKKSNQASALPTLDKDWIKNKRIGEIKNKMKAGRRLSHEEKEFLRIHAPDLYEKALKIEKERDEFRRALENCKTKEEAMRLKALKCMELKTEADATSCKTKDGKELDESEFIIMRMMAVFDEFADFAKSKEYNEMPNEHEENEEENYEKNDENYKESGEKNDGKNEEENEDMKIIGKGKKSKSKRAILTLNREMALNSYKMHEARIVNGTRFSGTGSTAKANSGSSFTTSPTGSRQ